MTIALVRKTEQTRHLCQQRSPSNTLDKAHCKAKKKRPVAPIYFFKMLFFPSAFHSVGSCFNTEALASLSPAYSLKYTHGQFTGTSGYKSALKGNTINMMTTGPHFKSNNDLDREHSHLNEEQIKCCRLLLFDYYRLEDLPGYNSIC